MRRCILAVPEHNPGSGIAEKKAKTEGTNESDETKKT